MTGTFQPLTDTLLPLVRTAAEQRRAADPSRSVWARANAGAGKTKVLIDRIARLLLAGAAPGRILGVTYTKAAAAEMQARLFARLGGWTVAPDDQLSRQLLELDPALDVSPAALGRARALFAQALETPGGLKVQTIHAFCQSVLRRFPLEAGIAPGFDVVQGALEDELARSALRVARQREPDAFAVLAAETSADADVALVREAASRLHPGPVDRAALPHRLAALIGASASRDPETLRQQVLSELLPTMLAAQADLAGGRDTDQRHAKAITSILAYDAAGDAAATWDAACRLVADSNGKLLKKRPGTKIVADRPVILALTAALDRLVEVRGEVLRLALLEASLALTLAASAWRSALAEAKSALGLVDYDDLLKLTARLLGSSGSAARWVLFKLDQGIDHVLIDEAQDTSPQQWDLLRPLFAVLEQDAAEGRPRTRFVVGDEKQSIYSFQGADPRRFLAEEAEFLAAPAALPSHQARFDLSFRTGQAILDAVDRVWAVSSPDAAPAGVEPETAFAAQRNHFAFRTDWPGVVELWPLSVRAAKPDDREAWDQPLDADRESSAPARLAQRIALDLRDRIRRGETVLERIDGREIARPLQAGDVMILVRKRGSLFQNLIRRLKAVGLPVAGADRIRLLDDVGVQDLLALARFALCPEDDFNLACVLKGAFIGLVDDDRYLFPIAHGRGAATLWDSLNRSPLPEHAGAARWLADLPPLAGALPPFEFLSVILEQPLPDGLTGWQSLVRRLGREVREPVEALLQRALDHGSRGFPGLAAFLGDIETQKPDVKRELEQSSRGVRVMTVHGAKGLEAPMVILPDTTGSATGRASQVLTLDGGRQLLWYARKEWREDIYEAEVAGQDAASLREAARLLYVAMTRARDRLVLCGHHHGSGNEGHASDSWWTWIKDALETLPGWAQRSLPPEAGDYGEEIAPQARFWGALPATSDAAALGQAAPDQHPLPPWLDRSLPARPGVPRRIAPSELAGGQADPPVLAPGGGAARQRLERGRLVHELLQSLPGLPQDSRRDAALARVARSSLPVADHAALAGEVLAVLDDPAFAPLFGPDSRAEVSVAGWGPGLPPSVRVAGTVDRLVVSGRDVMVLDFKTNRAPPRTAKEVAPVYLRQMAAYRAVLAAIWPGRTVRCALLWTDGPRLMELPDHLLDAALEDLKA
jgi:ATP-dependent helicase/nuclease subunit A